MSGFVVFKSPGDPPVWIRPDAVIFVRAALNTEAGPPPMTLLVLGGGVRQYVVGEPEAIIRQLDAGLTPEAFT